MVVLGTKVYVDGGARNRAIDALRSVVTNQIGALDVTVDIGVRHDGFPSVTITGADAVAARNVLRQEWGEITPSLEAGGEYVGTLSSWDANGFELDVGQPVRVPADELGLGPGTPGQVRERFGLVQHVRLWVEFGSPPRLAPRSLDQVYEWTRGPGRVNVNSVTRSQVRATVNRAGHAEDVIRVERLGLLEHSIVCAGNTDPPGLLAAIGDYLPAELMCVIP